MPPEPRQEIRWSQKQSCQNKIVVFSILVLVCYILLCLRSLFDVIALWVGLCPANASRLARHCSSARILTIPGGIWGSPRGCHGHRCGQAALLQSLSIMVSPLPQKTFPTPLSPSVVTSFLLFSSSYSPCLAFSPTDVIPTA